MDKKATESDGLLRNNSFSNVHRIEKRKSFRQNVNVRDGEVIHDAAYLLRRVIIGDNDIGSNWNYNDDYFNEDYFNDLDRRVMSKNVDKGIGNKIHEIQKSKCLLPFDSRCSDSCSNSCIILILQKSLVIGIFTKYSIMFSIFF